jgi:ParB/RepB/Spo0J family partition protein
MSAIKTANGNGRKSKAQAFDAHSEAELPPAIANRVNGKPPHPSINGTTTPAGIAVNDPAATGFSDEPAELQPLSGKTLERDYGGKTLSNMLLGALVRHPENRRPTDEAVAKMAASILKEGLLDPLVVRSLGDGRWQIISGETRYLALKQLGRKGCDAHVLHCDDARALELLATYNAERTDLNVIEKARMIQALCRPAAESGGGMTREQAAKIYGLETGAAASNLVRLLELPKVWQDRIASGEFPQTFARLLVPYAHAPRLMAVVDEVYRKAMKKGGYERDRWSDRAGVERQVDNIVMNHTRPVGKEKRFYNLGEKHGYHHGEYPILFKLTPELEAELGIVELTEGKKTVRMATNAELYDKHQLPLVIEKAKAKKRGDVGASSKDKGSKGEPTAAEKKAKAKEQERILEQRVDKWRHRLLRNLVAEELKRLPTFSWQHLKLLLWLTTQPQFSYSDEAALDLQGTVVASAGQRADEYVNSEDAWNAMHAKYYERKGYSDQRAGLEDISRQLLQKLFRTDPKNPDYQIIPLEVIEGAASDLSIDLADAWRKLQHASDQTELETLFELYSTDQLDELAKELGVSLANAGKKSAKVKVFVGSAKAGRLLKMPKSIKPLPTAEPAAAGGKKKKGGR